MAIYCKTKKRLCEHVDDFCLPVNVPPLFVSQAISLSSKIFWKGYVEQRRISSNELVGRVSRLESAKFSLNFALFSLPAENTTRVK